MQKRSIIFLFLLLPLLIMASAPIIKIENVCGTQIYLACKQLKLYEHYLVLGNKGEFKGEVKIMERESRGHYMAKEVVPAVRDFRAEVYQKDDTLVPFRKFSLAASSKIPLFCKGDYFFINGTLESVQTFGEDRIYLKFRIVKHLKYIPEQSELQFANYYAEKDRYQTMYFVAYFSGLEIDVPLETGQEYAFYGELVDSTTYPTFRGMRLSRQ
ncbi:MAG: hypothetical protein PHW04_00240 [Candidatus Wallbacteria bacterium]|nr:hypothetical protein [Candidatus Wallbacteria bacterium]